MPEGDLKDAARHVDPMKAAVRSKVEHPFRVVKRQFGHQKVRLMDLAKNTARILTLFALSNLWTMRRTLRAFAGEVRPWFGGYAPTRHQKHRWTIAKIEIESNSA
jgi:IS5 family transposase